MPAEHAGRVVLVLGDGEQLEQPAPPVLLAALHHSHSMRPAMIITHTSQTENPCNYFRHKGLRVKLYCQAANWGITRLSRQNDRSLCMKFRIMLSIVSSSGLEALRYDFKHLPQSFNSRPREGATICGSTPCGRSSCG